MSNLRSRTSTTTSRFSSNEVVPPLGASVLYVLYLTHMSRILINWLKHKEAQRLRIKKQYAQGRIAAD